MSSVSRASHSSSRLPSSSAASSYRKSQTARYTSVETGRAPLSGIVRSKRILAGRGWTSGSASAWIGSLRAAPPTGRRGWGRDTACRLRCRGTGVVGEQAAQPLSVEGARVGLVELAFVDDARAGEVRERRAAQPHSVVQDQVVATGLQRLADPRLGLPVLRVVLLEDPRRAEGLDVRRPARRLPRVGRVLLHQAPGEDLDAVRAARLPEPQRGA